MHRQSKALLKGSIGLSIVLLCGAGPAAAQEALSPGTRAVTIGVVTDGPSPGAMLDDLIEMELRRLVAARGVELTFKSPPEFDAGWRAAGMAPALRAALDDPEVDLVLTTGLLTTQAATRATLAKPVVSAFLQRVDLFSVADLERDRSLQENLSFVLLAGRIESDLTSLQEMEASDRVHLAIPEEFVEQLDAFGAEIVALQEASGIDLEVVALSADVPESLARVDSTVTAVLLVPTPRYSPDQRRALIRGLTERGLPTFSSVGHGDLELGAMAARTPRVATAVSRRVALNLYELIRGAEVGDLPVLITDDPRLVIAGRTAAEVGYRPSLITRGYAEILDPEALQLAEEPLELARAYELALLGNPNLAISSQQVEVSRRNRQLSLSPMLPQAGASLDVTWQDVGTLEGIFPDRLVRTGVQARQMIYDDATISRYRASGRLYESQQQSYQTARLDVLQRAGVAFLRYQLARSLYQIELANLRLTEENLELARFRERVGYSGRDEVYRWESEAAKGRSDLYSRMAVAESERIALNQILGIDQGSQWDPVDIPVDSEVFPFLDGRLPSVISDIEALDVFRDIVVQLSFESAPELASVVKRREAREIELGQRKRAWFLPSLYAAFQWAYQIDRDPEVEGLNRSLPAFELGATYPLLQGGARSFEVGRSTAELDRLLEEERLTKDLVERGTRTALSRLEASFPSIRFSRIAAESARRNLELVQEKYAQGLVNVTDLLQAQTESFGAQQSAAGSVSFFLIDLVNFQRSISWFEYERTPEERDALLQRIQAAIGR